MATSYQYRALGTDQPEDARSNRSFVMPPARPPYAPAESGERSYCNGISLQPRHSAGLFRRSLNNSKRSLSPSYKLGTILGTIGGVALLLLCLLYLWYIGRTRPKSGSESDTIDSSGRPPRDPPPLPIDQGRPDDRGPQGDGRPIERVPMGDGEPIEIMHNGQGRPLEQVQQEEGPWNRCN